MNVRYAFPLAALSIPFAASMLASPVGAQDAPATGAWEVPRTEHGHPDLQGNWSNGTITPIERPSGQDAVLTREQAMALEGMREEDLRESFDPADPDRPPPPQGGEWQGADPVLIAAGGGTGGYDLFYLDRGDRVAVVDGEPRSSLVTIPEDGRIPPLNDEARQRQAERSAFRSQFGSQDHPELLSLSDRCIISFGSNAGPPMLPNYFYNDNYTIVQTADHVVILTEMVHDARIVRLEDGPELPEEIRPWFGDSRGYWDDDTLVVETTNIRPAGRWEAAANMKVTERFTRVDEETILYEFFVEDPSTWDEPWGGQVPMHAMDGLVHEYACHEGNYAMENILRGARFEERRQAEDRDR